MKYDDFIEIVRNRRNIRQFKPDPIPDGYVEKILEAGRWAMSGGNAQPWEFIVIRSRETINKIIELFMPVQEMYRDIEKTRMPELRHPLYSRPERFTPAFKNAPVIIVVCGDTRTFQTSVLATGFFVSEGSADAVFHKSLACATQNLHLAATTLGLGSQWFSVSYPWEAKLKALLGVPDEFKIGSLVTIGYPAYRPTTVYRRELQEIVHYEKYDISKYRTGEDIYKYISELRQRMQGSYKY
jgi:5,6-dimethylbenzimidazole synthase